jgi:enoyl-CoA hydratase/carnithine racemase
MNRPQKKNALTLEMYQTLLGGLAQAAGDAQIRCVLLHGGNEAFTAGNDLRDFALHPPEDTSAPAFQFMHSMMYFPKPIVAAVAGVAVGIGTTILPYCDLVYAAESARFQMPFVDLGLVPEAGSTFTMPFLLGPHKAAEYLLLGTPFGAAEALQMGLINAIVPAAELIPRATEVAEQLANKAPNALRHTKQLLRQSWLDWAEEAHGREAPLFLEALRGPESQEALSAFLAKRPPDFRKLGA